MVLIIFMVLVMYLLGILMFSFMFSVDVFFMKVTYFVAI